jgi:3-hydroxybutyryl-CoA dehydrogenase
LGVVEAIFEKLEAKHEVFRALDKICKPGAVLGTNTSAIPITQIATVTDGPSRWSASTSSRPCR